MSIFTGIASLASGIVSPIANIFTKRNDNKTAIKKKQLDRVMNADDSLAEWETLLAEKSGGTWKDEYITLIITLPIIVTFIAVFASVIFSNPLYAEAAKAGVTAIKDLVPDYGKLLYIVCLAAIGIKAFKK